MTGSPRASSPITSLPAAENRNADTPFSFCACSPLRYSGRLLTMFSAVSPAASRLQTRWSSPRWSMVSLTKKGNWNHESPSETTTGSRDPASRRCRNRRRRRPLANSFAQRIAFSVRNSPSGPSSTMSLVRHHPGVEGAAAFCVDGEIGRDVLLRDVRVHQHRLELTVRDLVHGRPPGVRRTPHTWLETCWCGPPGDATLREVGTTRSPGDRHGGGDADHGTHLDPARRGRRLPTCSRRSTRRPRTTRSAGARRPSVGEPHAAA
jgi:hypothetical protein